MSAERDRGENDGSGLGKPISRRFLLKGAAGVAAGAAAAHGAFVGDVAQAMSVAKEAPPPPLRFLTQFEFEYVTVMAETIWPTDDLGPGARVAGVGQYIDGQLAGSWGQGHRLFLNGPFFQPETSGHGWQIPMTPADVYRAFLPGFDVYCKQVFGNAYPALPAAQQTQALTDLQTGKAPIQIGGSTAFTSADFFSLFRQNVLEGMLADPAYGGNRNMIGWEWIGFPGDPMRRGDIYEQYIFNNKPYPFAGKPLPLAASSLKAAAKGAAAPAAITKTSKSTKGGM
jgi:gluconate 2-dehydrogenase gamma chain